MRFLDETKRINEMNNVYVLIMASFDNVKVKVYSDKENAASYVMEYVYGEDWEFQMDDEDWELSAEIRDNYRELLDGYGFKDAEGVMWSIEETEVID